MAEFLGVVRPRYTQHVLLWQIGDFATMAQFGIFVLDKREMGGRMMKRIDFEHLCW